MEGVEAEDKLLLEGARVIPFLNQITCQWDITITSPHFFLVLSFLTHRLLTRAAMGNFEFLAFCHLPPSLPASQHIGSSSSTASSDAYHPFHRCSSWWPKLYGDNCRLHCKYFFSQSLLVATVSSLIFSNYSERAHPSCPTWPQGLFQVTAYDSPVCVSSFFRHIYKSTGCRHLVDFPSSLCPHGVNSLHDSSTPSLCILTHRRQRAIKGGPSPLNGILQGTFISVSGVGIATMD